MKIKWGIGVTVAIVLAVLAVFVVGPATAQEPTQTPQATPTVPAYGPWMRGLGIGPLGRAGALAEVLKVLNMSATDLINELRSGKTLSDIGKEKGVTDQQLIDALVSARKAALDQAVKDGRLTQAQADALLNAARAMAQFRLITPFTAVPGAQWGWKDGNWGRGFNKMMPRMPRGPWGRDGWRGPGFGRGKPFWGQAPAAPTATPTPGSSSGA